MSEKLNIYNISYTMHLMAKYLEEMHPLPLPEELNFIDEHLKSIQRVLDIEDQEILRERAIYTLAERKRSMWNTGKVKIDPFPDKLQAFIDGKPNKELE